MADNQYISPFVSNGDTFRSADKTSYDLTNSNPAGGPINSPQYKHSHTYTSKNTYLDNFQAEASNNSAFGTEGNEILNNSIFEKTKLDIENPLPVGGPNRTNIPNIPSGEYVNIKTSNINGESPFPGGTLKTKDGKDYKTIIQQWNSSNTYLDSQKPEDQLIIPEIPIKPINTPSPETQDLLNQLPTDLGSGNQPIPDLVRPGI
jgi:hypothetical protein